MPIASIYKNELVYSLRNIIIINSTDGELESRGSQVPKNIPARTKLQMPAMRKSQQAMG